MLSRYRIVTLVLALGSLLAPATEIRAADTKAYIRPGVAVGRAYESNIFWSSANAQSDRLWRVSPSIEGGYGSDKWTLAAYGSFDFERYTDHPELDGNTVRRYTTLSLGFRQTPRLTESLSTSYTSTETPQQLNRVTTLQLGRVHATELAVKPAVDYRFSDITQGSIGYSFTGYQLAGSPDTNAQTGTAKLATRVSDRNTLKLEIDATRYDFGLYGTSRSSVLTLGWLHLLSQDSEFELGVGPRHTDGENTPELEASLRHSMESGSFMFSYRRSQTMILGQRGPIDTRELGANFTYAPTHTFTMQLSPNYVYEQGSTGDARFYRLNASMQYRLNDNVSFLGAYLRNSQRGLLGGPAQQDINDTSIYIGLVLSTAPSGVDIFTKRDVSPYSTGWPVSTRRDQTNGQPSESQ